MNGTSGVRVTSRDIDGICSCGFDDVVEEFINPENYTSGWKCPDCGAWHETDTADRLGEEDPDDARDRWLEDQ